MTKQPQQRTGIPIERVQFRAVQTFGKGQSRRAIAIDTTKPGWHDGVKMRWLQIGVEVRFPDGETYLVGHAAVESAKVEMSREGS